MKLQDRVAIVTGAGRGIGKAIAEALAAQGAGVVVNDVDEAAAKAVCSGIAGKGGRAVPCAAAIGTEAAAKQIVKTAVENFGALHILVNNAAIGGDSPILDMPASQVERSLTVNLVGAILLAKEAVAVMVPNKYGKIVNLTSRSGLRGKFGESAYSAGKAGLAGFTLSLSIEMAPHKINVNAIAPAAWTQLLEDMQEPERSRTIAKRQDNVLGRVAQPADVAPTVVFLVSDDAEYLTGQIVEVTGQQMAML